MSCTTTLRRLALAPLALTGLALTGPRTLAQTAAPAPCAVPTHLPGRIATALRRWKDAHGCEWQLVHDRTTGKGRMLFGGGAQTTPPFVPRTVPEVFLLARHWIQQAHGILDVDDLLLQNDRLRLLPLSASGTTDKVTVRFRQVVAGVPVDNASVNVLFDRLSARLLSIDSTALPGLASFEVAPSVSRQAARDAARAAFWSEVGRAADLARRGHAGHRPATPGRPVRAAAGLARRDQGPDARGPPGRAPVLGGGHGRAAHRRTRRPHPARPRPARPRAAGDARPDPGPCDAGRGRQRALALDRPLGPRRGAGAAGTPRGRQ